MRPKAEAKRGEGRNTFGAVPFDFKQPNRMCCKVEEGRRIASGRTVPLALDRDRHTA
jgi:hypothetical protein